MNCNECRWFDSQKIEDNRFGSKTLLGICRKRPPFVSLWDTDTMTSGWPKTSGCDWCGEWEDIIDDTGTTEEAVPGRRWTDWMDDLDQMPEAVTKVQRPHRTPILRHRV